MKKLIAAASACLFAATGAMAQNQAPNKVRFDTDRQRMSYGVGLNMGRSLVSDGVDANMLDPAWIAKGIADVLAGAEPALSEEEFKGAMEKLVAALNARRQAEKKAALEKNQAVYAQKKKEGFQLTNTGLMYKVVKPGAGASPKLTDKVKVHYQGAFPDGTVFDSSYERKEPLEQPVQGFIEGWIEALQMMKPGAKWQLVVPPELGYGEQGVQGIPPHSVLVFDIELVDIVK